MDRRKFLSLAAFAGLGVVSPRVFGGDPTRDPITGKRKEPLFATYGGPFYVLINAMGGWDPTSLCDPKGYAFPDDPEALNRSYATSDILTAGNIKFAPLGNMVDDGYDNYYQLFFEKHYQRLMVLNGVDTQTNGHDSGIRHCMCGRLAEGFPSFGALVAASASKELPMAYLSFGGYDETMGIVARTRSGNTNALARIAYPDRRDPNDEMTTFHSAKAAELIKSAQDDRRTHLESIEYLPRTKHAIGMLYAARTGSNELKKLQEYLPDMLSQNGNERQAQVALAAYKAGICAAVNMSIGGYDTHGNHDQSHIPRLVSLLQMIDFLWEEADRQGVADKLVVLVGSDFGRTPRYNDGNGKDHWSVTSMMLMGAGIPGNRVIGASDAGHNPMTINPSSLQLDPGGIRLEPKHVHRSLRRLAGIEDNEYGRMFPLMVADGEDINIFG
ncbi:MAG: DUF1501 domain-containing protein [Myxococcales bacterium]|nr:DUF1501 domain-containing protein [Myxococcales bacterium]MCB9702822.1 DUF1501 domain-containing protein [Myxococcales bacterium]